MRALINRITPCTERRIWFTFGLFKQSLGHRPVIQLDCFLSVHGKKSCESRVQSTVQSRPESRFCKGPLTVGICVGRYKQWNGLLEWNTGMEHWTGLLEWFSDLYFSLIMYDVS